MAADGRAVITWATSEAPFAASVDATRIGVAGHSLGGKLSTLITMDDDRIDALYAIDPVDGDPSPLGGGGSRDRPDLVPARGSEITVPAGFAGETTNGMSSGGFGSMACAPSEQNFQQFYAAATAAPWAAQWDITGADHMDFLDDPDCGFTCSVCPDGPADDATVLGTNRTLLTAFFRRHLAGDARDGRVPHGRDRPDGRDDDASPLTTRCRDPRRDRPLAPKTARRQAPAPTRAPTRVAPTRVAPTRVAPTRVAPTRVAPTRVAP
jgi:hypothetical protein